jgi:ankyrin repeat protein
MFGSPQKKLDKKLVKAAEKGDVLEVIRLLDAGANVNAQSSFRNPPLFAAAYAGDSDGHLQVIEVLIARGADVNARNSVACTPLMGAAYCGHVGAARRLLAAGADPEMRGREKNALEFALSSGSPDMILLLQKKPEAPAPVAANPQDVVFRRPLGNRLMEEVYDFEARERITLIRNGEDGPVEAVTRDSFTSIEDRARLREAFDLYAKRGGNLTEEDVFVEHLSKPKPPAKGL